MNIENSRKAIKAASDFYKSVSHTEDIRLEGIEMKGEDYKITLSYPEEGQYIFADKSKRHYNTFIIDKDFNLVSMGVEHGTD